MAIGLCLGGHDVSNRQMNSTQYFHIIIVNLNNMCISFPLFNLNINMKVLASLGLQFPSAILHCYEII